VYSLSVQVANGKGRRVRHEAMKNLARPLAATKTNLEHRTLNVEHPMGEEEGE